MFHNTRDVWPRNCSSPLGSQLLGFQSGAAQFFSLTSSSTKEYKRSRYGNYTTVSTSFSQRGTCQIINVTSLVESELHDGKQSPKCTVDAIFMIVFEAYGTTEKLSKFWMPLEEYTTKTMEGLEKGDINICTGNILGVFEKFEKGKDELAEQFQKRREEW